MAAFTYDLAKKQARLANAKKAHDDVIGAVFRAQADAFEIEAQAKRRLADEYAWIVPAAMKRAHVRQQTRMLDRCRALYVVAF